MEMTIIVTAVIVYAVTRIGNRAVAYLPPGRAKRAMVVVFGGGGPGEE